MGNAVVRARAKRRIRELFRRDEPDVTRQRGLVPMDLVVIPRRELATAPFTSIATEYHAMLTKARRAAGATK